MSTQDGMTQGDFFLFVSHVNEDHVSAMQIVAELERRGVHCWIAPRDVHPGKPFDDEIADAIEASRAMLLIFSDNCNTSEYIRREVTVAGESQKVIIPFRIENAQPKRGLRVRLSDLHWIDAFVSREQAIDEVVKTFGPPGGGTIAETASPKPTQLAKSPGTPSVAATAAELRQSIDSAQSAEISTEPPASETVSATFGAARSSESPREIGERAADQLLRESERSVALTSRPSVPAEGPIASSSSAAPAAESSTDAQSGVRRRALLIGGGAAALGAFGAGVLWLVPRTEHPSAGVEKPLVPANETGVRTFAGHTGAVWSVGFSPDNRTALSGSADRTLKAWDIATGNVVRTFTGHADTVRSVAHSPDGRTALSGSEDRTVKLWDIATGDMVRTFTGHADNVVSIAFSPDGRTALSGSSDRTAKLWDISTGLALRTLKPEVTPTFITCVAFSPDGFTALVGDLGGVLNLWDLARARVVQTFRSQAAVFSVAFSTDGRTALSSGDSPPSPLALWDVSTGSVIRTFTEDPGRTFSVKFSPDGRAALSGSGNRTLKLWDIATGKELRTFRGHSDSVISVAFSPDGRTALSGSSDKTLKLWEVT
jgi:hypothetical protein